MPTLRLVSVLLFASFLSGCASLSTDEREFFRRYKRFLQEEARSRYLEVPDARPDLERAARQLLKETIRPEYVREVLSGKIRRGMNTREVRYTLGQPRLRTTAEASGRSEQWWTYERDEKLTLVFRNDTLIGIGADPPKPKIGPGPGGARE